VACPPDPATSTDWTSKKNPPLWEYPVEEVVRVERRAVGRRRVRISPSNVHHHREGSTMTRLALSISLIAAVCALPAMPAHAVAPTRVFVAAQGSDSNPCSFALPCRTFQHAHDTVAADGEIDVLDPAGYGTVNITKGLSIQGHGFAGISTGVNGGGVLVFAGANDAVTINGLLIDGGGVGNTGISFGSAKSLTITNCIIRHFAGAGIALDPNASSKLVVADTLVIDIGLVGITMNPSGSGTVNASFNRVGIYNTGTSGSGGFNIAAGNSTGTITAVVVDSESSNAANDAFSVVSSQGHAATLMLIRSVAAGNGTGIDAIGPGATIYVSQSSVTNNTNGWAASAGGAILTYGNNNINGNGFAEGAQTSVGFK
jgi:hypothetical protein